MPGFVIEYNRITGDHLVTEYSGADGHRAALLRRLELEKIRPSAEWEIVSLNSDSLDTVRKTHSRYFTGHAVHKMSA
ncbi:hypothetical protein [Arthrobacter globiformis]|uniref:Uncharacterized protein n=1 Tax=Arthrobacter globiformis TaxID=1665 RepID=A0A328HFL9_ARTGO|nr:hypothetical protein [Arthrobacter globiformis]RAM37347.1 hypothetical protein DBZ45_11090 [Arthrobacter globiformis]